MKDLSTKFSDNSMTWKIKMVKQSLKINLKVTCSLGFQKEDTLQITDPNSLLLLKFEFEPACHGLREATGVSRILHAKSGRT